MLDRDAFEMLLVSWKQQYGTEYRGRTGNTFMVVPGKVAQRREMLRYLIDTLITEHKYEKDDFNSSTKAMIEEACVWPEWNEVKRLREWRKNVYNDIIYVLAEAYPETFQKQERALEPPKEYKSADGDYNPDKYAGVPQVNFDSDEGAIHTGRKELDLSKIPKVESDWVMMSNDDLLKDLEGGLDE